MGKLLSLNWGYYYNDIYLRLNKSAVIDTKSHTFVNCWVLLNDGQRGTRRWLAEGVTAALFYLCWHLHLGVACLTTHRVVISHCLFQKMLRVFNRAIIKSK